MNKITFDQQSNNVVIKITGLDILWTFRAKMTIPINQIKDISVKTDTELKSEGMFKNFQVRALGTRYPGRISGIFLGNNTKSFANVSGLGPKDKILLISLQHSDNYTYVFLTVPNPEEIVKEINQFKTENITHVNS